MRTHYSRNIGIASIAGLTALTGCSSEEKQYKNWMETEGAANRINLDEVSKALEESKGITEFENRVNEIYEGPHVVMIEVKDLGNGKKVITGWEDTDNNRNLSQKRDFKLFTTTVGDGSYETVGGGAHSYYHHHGVYNPMGGFFLGYIMGSWTSATYYTSPARYVEIHSHQRTYRSSSKYKMQKSKNSAFRKGQVLRNPQAAKGFRSKVPSSRSGFRSGS